MRRLSPVSRRLRGLTLIETALVLAIASIAAGWGLWALAQSMESEKAKMQGQQLAVLGAALSDYSKQHFTVLAAGAAIAGFANSAQPTVAELRTAGFLDPTFSANSLYQTGYTLRVTRSGPCNMGATTPGCNVTSVAALSAPMQFRGRTAWASLGEAVNAIGASGGFSSQSAPTVISSANGTWTNANPLGTAGILAYRDVYSQSDNSTFLRRDGAFPMTGNLQMGGNDIRAGGGDLLTEGGQISTAGGSISAGSGSVTAGSFTATGVVRGGSLTTTGSVTAGSVAASGAVIANSLSAPTVSATSVTASGAIQGSSLTVTGAGSITMGGGHISGLRVASAGGACSPQRAVATSSAGELLSCQAGSWRRQSTNSDGGLVIDKIAYEGGGCSPAGAIARTSAGKLLACQSGTWQGGGSALTSFVVTGERPLCGETAVAYCPTGSMLTGGGFWGSDTCGCDSQRVTLNLPNSYNGWEVRMRCGKPLPYAICAR